MWFNQALSELFQTNMTVKEKIKIFLNPSMRHRKYILKDLIMFFKLTVESGFYNDKAASALHCKCNNRPCVLCTYPSQENTCVSRSMISQAVRGNENVT